MDTYVWLFVSEIFILIMIWVFILEFNEGFGREEDLERIVYENMLAKNNVIANT